MDYMYHTTVSHIVSQSVWTWLPVLQPPRPVEPSDLPDPVQVSRRGWRDFIATQRREGNPDFFPWIHYVRRRDGPGDDQLAARVYGEIQQLQAGGARIIPRFSTGFPPALRRIADPPALLVCVGNPSLLRQEGVAIVGSRKASRPALQASARAGLMLARAGRPVISGGALGCDIAAHAGVLHSGQRPAPAVVVQAGGLAGLYPRRNKPVFDEILAAGGCLISERLWKAPCRPMDFPVRNRIVSGMVGTVLVMQSAPRSGAMVTARLALDQGREILVYRHASGDVRGDGNRQLMEEGAESFTTVEPGGFLP